MHGQHILSHWSKLQSTIALSSGEAELNAGVKGISETIGIHELFKEWDMNEEAAITLYTDSSAAKGTLTRRGRGKIKHLTTKQLWVQEAIRTYDVKVVKIPRHINSADLLTHPCGKVDYTDHLDRLKLLRP